jgi:hypothetical protein
VAGKNLASVGDIGTIGANLLVGRQVPLHKELERWPILSPNPASV